MRFILKPIILLIIQKFLNIDVPLSVCFFSICYKKQNRADKSTIGDRRKKKKKVYRRSYISLHFRKFEYVILYKSFNDNFEMIQLAEEAIQEAIFSSFQFLLYPYVKKII